MVMQSDGTAYPVDWYFADSGAPFLGKLTTASINWERPHYGSGVVGEVPGAARTWRNGSVPEYVGFDAHGSRPIAGLPQWWISGAPRPGSGGLRFDGSRGFTDVKGPGIFPPIFPPALPNPPLVSSIRGPATLLGISIPGQAYEWSWPTLGFNIVWAKTNDKLFGCVPNIAAMWGHSGETIAGYMKCTAYNPSTGVSTWIDGQGTVLSPGEVLTLTGPTS